MKRLSTLSSLLLVFLLGLTAPLWAQNKEIAWILNPTKKHKLVFQDGKKIFNWEWNRDEADVIATFSSIEKRILRTLYPKAAFAVQKMPGKKNQQEVLLLSRGKYISKDDLFVSSAELFDLKATDYAAAFLITDPQGKEGERRMAALALLVDRPNKGLAIATFFGKAPYRLESDVEYFGLMEFGPKGGWAIGLVERYRDEEDPDKILRRRMTLFRIKRGRLVLSWRGTLLTESTRTTRRRGAELSFRDLDGDGTFELLSKDRFFVAHPPTAGAYADLRSYAAWHTDREAPLAPGVWRVFRATKDRHFSLEADGWVTATGEELKRHPKSGLWPTFFAYEVATPPFLLRSLRNLRNPFELYQTSVLQKDPRANYVVPAKYVFKGEEAYSGPKDLRVTPFIMHDAENLYVSAVVEDDRLVLPSRPGRPLSQTDHVKLWLAPHGEGASPVLIELSPGNFKGMKPEARIRRPTGIHLAEWKQIRLAAVSNDRWDRTGYWIEAAIPRKLLAQLGCPIPPDFLRVALMVVDADDPTGKGTRTVLSTSKDLRWSDPTSFNDLVIERP